LHCFILKREALGFSKTLAAIYLFMWHNNPEDMNLHQPHCKGPPASEFLITSCCNGNTQYLPNKTNGGYIHEDCGKDKITIG
jgi:hypothetical protein